MCVRREVTPGKWEYETFVGPRLGTGLRIAIAEAPGEQEAIQGEPLVGGAGNWLRGVRLPTGERVGGLYHKAGVRDKDITFANIIQCRPPNNVFPTDGAARCYISKQDAARAVAQCWENHLQPLLRSRPWERVDIFGDKALEHLTGKTEGITTWRGAPLVVPELGDKPIAIPTLHPAFIARNQKLLPAVVSDLKKGTWVPPENYDLDPDITTIRAFQPREFAFDIETGWPVDPAPTMVGFSTGVGRAIVVPFRGPYVAEIKRIFRGAQVVVGHNIVHFDLPHLKKYGVELGPETEERDTMLIHHLIQPDLPHDLEFVASIFCNKPPWKHEKKESEELYNARDVDVSWQIYRAMWPILGREGLATLYELVSVPVAKICRLMHDTGFKMDTSRLGVVREGLLRGIKEDEAKLPPELAPRMETRNRNVKAPPGTRNAKGRLIKVIKEAYQEEVRPWRSNKVLMKYFYEDKGLPVQFHPKTKKPTIGKMALEKLYRKSLLPELKVLRGTPQNPGLKQKDKLLTSFCQKELEEGPGWAHPHFNTHGTGTGRLSSADPNFQNLPPTARVLYIPKVEGWRVMDVDYSGIENRLTAWFAKDRDLLKKMEDPNFNEHKWMTGLVYGIPYVEVIKDSDREAPYGRCKVVNHGTNYLLGFKTLAKNLDVMEKEAKELLAKIRGFKPRICEWQDRGVREAERTGFVCNPFGRKRWGYKMKGQGPKMVATLPQGTAADVILRAMIGLMYERIGWSEEKARRVCPIVRPLPKPALLHVQCHDSLVFSYPPELEDELKATVKLVMEQPWPELGGFALPVSVGVGLSWGECQ